MQYEFGGGAVRLGQAVYVTRPVDTQIKSFLLNSRNLVTVTAPRQMGKSSLLHSIVPELMAAGQKVAFLDFREVFGLPNEGNRHREQWFPIFYRAVARGLHIPIRAVNDWLKASDADGSVAQMVAFFADFIRERLHDPITLMVDEIDIVKLYWYHTDDFFEALRALASKRDELDVSLVISGINPPMNLLKVFPPSLFNIANAIHIGDFTPDDATVDAWTQGLPYAAATRMELGQAVLEQTGGQPYLSSVLFNDVLETGVRTAEEVERLATQFVADVRNEDRHDAHFQAAWDIILEFERDAYRALETYGKLRQEPLSIHDVEREALQLLRITGLAVERKGQLAVKSPIYRQFFDEAWVERLKREIGRRSRPGAARGAAALPQKEVQDTICVLNTGGMISAELRNDGTIAEPLDLDAFFHDFPEMYTIANIDPVPLMGKDSSNMNPDDWRIIAEAIYARRNRGYKGFVVAHGTDTMAYTASAVAFALGPGLNFPVVFTASQVARHVAHGDARPNLLRACAVATMDIPEVVVVTNDQVFRAVRVEKKDDYRFESFHSPTMGPLAIIADRIEPLGRARTPDESRGLECRAKFSDGVFKFAFFPGLNPRLLTPILDTAELRGIIIETPGIGNLPTDGVNYSLLPFIETATREKHIPVLLVSQYPIQIEMSAVYAPASKPIQRGAIPAANMSLPAAVTKFMWILPQIEERIKSGDIGEEDKFRAIRDFMNRNIVGEINQSQKNTHKS